MSSLKHGEWFRFGSVIPDQGEKVLIWQRDLMVAGEYWMHEPGIHDGDSGFINHDGDDVFQVTHWMPQPKGPDHDQR